MARHCSCYKLKRLEIEAASMKVHKCLKSFKLNGSNGNFFPEMHRVFKSLEESSY